AARLADPQTGRAPGRPQGSVAALGAAAITIKSSGMGTGLGIVAATGVVGADSLGSVPDLPGDDRGVGLLRGAKLAGALPCRSVAFIRIHSLQRSSLQRA